jgi:hypothetical protein
MKHSESHREMLKRSCLKIQETKNAVMILRELAARTMEKLILLRESLLNLDMESFRRKEEKIRSMVVDRHVMNEAIMIMHIK